MDIKTAKNEADQIFRDSISKIELLFESLYNALNVFFTLSLTLSVLDLIIIR